MAVEVVLLPASVARRLREEARRRDMTPEERLVELLSQGLDPRERVVEYIEAALGLLEEAREELKRGDVRQAAGKLVGCRGPRGEGLRLLEGG